MNSLWAASNALSAAASSCVNWGGGDGGAGFLNTTDTLALINFRREVIRRVAAALRTGFFICLGFGAAFRVAFLATTRTDFARVFVAFAFVALFARAFPAAERFVAGFNRVDFATARFAPADLPLERREAERDEAFFSDLATGLLIRTRTQHSLRQAELRPK